ncbi:MAG: TlpA family protein disulfide reductase [Chloroflexota bacterium]|jgi:thiol-disulfide isomerase/thioredoxin
MIDPSHHRKNAFPLPLVVAGLGLILLGVAAFALLPKAAASLEARTENISSIPVSVEYEAPALSLTDLAGSPISLADYRGQVALVNLWATWCPPCKAEMPTLQAYYEAYQMEGFTIIAINDGDPAADVAQFVEEYALTFPVWLDPQYIATEQAFKNMSLPSSYVIDRAGIVRLQWVGEISYAALEKYVTPLIME